MELDGGRNARANLEALTPATRRHRAPKRVLTLDASVPPPGLPPRVQVYFSSILPVWYLKAMSGDEEEYAVESILGAKVAKKRGKKVWLYCVKWKNYGFDDNTWEPVESFAGGSEHFIERFWPRVSTNGRDYNDLGEFGVGEEFLPSGPPRRKQAKKVAEPVDIIEIPSSPSPVQNADSETEVRSIIGDDVDKPVAVTTRGKRRRSSAGADAESSPVKRKRGRPPGKRPAELEAEIESKAVTRRKSLPEIPRTNRGRVQVAESSSAARPPPIPRTRGRPPKAAPVRPSSSSADELLLHPEANGKSRSSPAKRKTKEAKSPQKTAPDDGGSTSQDAIEASAMIVDDSEDEVPTFGTPTLFVSEPAPVPEAPKPGPSMPAHRVRAANPRVKVTDDPNLTETSGALSVKSRFMKRAAAESNGDQPASPARVSKGKAGPGRSSSSLVVGTSRLVAHKGTLMSVRSNAGPSRTKPSKKTSTAEQNDDPANAQDGLFDDPAEANDVPGLGQHDVAPKPPPTGAELLKEAGLNPLASKDLPDFEEDADGEYEVEIIEQQAQVVQPQNGEGPQLNSDGAALEPATQEVVDKPPEKPPVILQARPLTFTTRVASAWSQSTIFGPLALGLGAARNQAQTDAVNSSSAAKRYTLNLNLDSSISIPVTLKDTHAPTTFLEKIDANARNPTGKFYKDEAAIVLLNTLDPQASYARVALSDGTTDEQKKHFERFISRISAGELFMQVNRFELLVMCASENSVLCQKLGVPAPLQGLVGTVILAHVSIVDHSAYVDATEYADNSRW
ncbi:hypothetical protein C2E23DRAFT_89037 [Lenzites betulinus]|nr:hypothetical protein C2E23DRAFT_89037 [Lenzites betulinus]